MYAAFVKLLNMSAASGILIAAVIGLRSLLRKVPKKYICILWALVALRLVCPVTISSSLSVFNHVGTYHPDNGQIECIRYNEKTEKPMGGKFRLWKIPFLLRMAPRLHITPPTSICPQPCRRDISAQYHKLW